MKAAFEKDDVSKFTVPILKEWAQKKNIPIHGKKNDIVERIQEYFENK
jgi:ATP-dependent DNA helicase 2 subunit 1